MTSEPKLKDGLHYDKYLASAQPSAVNTKIDKLRMRAFKTNHEDDIRELRETLLKAWSCGELLAYDLKSQNVRSDAARHAAQNPMTSEPEQAPLVVYYLMRMDDELLARDGSAELSHEEAKQALRDVYLISKGEEPEFHPNRILGHTPTARTSEPELKANCEICGEGVFFGIPGTVVNSDGKWWHGKCFEAQPLIDQYHTKWDECAERLNTRSDALAVTVKPLEWSDRDYAGDGYKINRMDHVYRLYYREIFLGDYNRAEDARGGAETHHKRRINEALSTARTEAEVRAEAFEEAAVKMDEDAHFMSCHGQETEEWCYEQAAEAIRALGEKR